MIERFDGKAAAREFLQSQVHLNRLRMLLIERCIEEAAFDEAMRLIQEGIVSSEQRRLPGLVNQYRALRVKLLEQSGDKNALLEAARALWLDQGDEDTFTLLKQIVPPPEWNGFVDRLTQEIRRLPDQLAWLYAHENRSRDLMALVQSSKQAVWLLEGYREPLESRFPDQMADIYEKVVESLLARASGRNQYQQAVAYLRRIKKLNQSARAEAIAARIKQQYANRPALLDELSRL